MSIAPELVSAAAVLVARCSPMIVDRIQSKAARLRRIEHLLYNAPQGLRVTDLADHVFIWETPAAAAPTRLF